MKNREIIKQLNLQLQLQKEIRKAKKSLEHIDTLLYTYISEVSNAKKIQSQ